MSDSKLHRREYQRGKLRRSDLAADPIEQFRKWYDDAAAEGHLDPAAMTLATSSPDGCPNARMVLLKTVNARGFIFCTHKDSPKGQELLANPRAALVFHWPRVERQVRIIGAASWMSADENAALFHARPRDAQVAATLGGQSAPVSSRKELDDKFKAAQAEFGSKEIPAPSGWGGFAIEPESIEFWQGGVHRLHDRFQYVRQADGWRLTRLMP